MKKTFCVLLALCMSLTALLSACGAEKKPEETPSQPVEEGDASIDLFGDKFVLIQDSEVTKPFSYLENTDLADKAIERVHDVENQYNCDIELGFVAYSGYSSVILPYVATLENFGDILFTQNCSQLRLVAHGDGLVAIDDVSEILDYKDHEKWGSVEILEAMMVKGTLYAVSPQTWLNLISIPYYTLVYNGDIVVDEFNMTDPHELYEQKGWTRDVLENYIKTCSNPSADDKLFGLAACQKHLVRQAILSNGCAMLEIKDDGTIDCGWATDDALEGMTWAAEFMKNNKDILKTSFSGDWDAYKTFDEMKASFLLTKYTYVVNDVAYDVDNFGIMPWPSGPNLEYGQWIGYYENASAAAIPVFTKDEESSALIINKIFEPIGDYKTMDDIKSYYRINVFHSDIDVDILFGERSGYTQYCYWPDGGDEMLNAIQNTIMTRTAAECVETNRSKLEKVIEENIYPNRANIDKYR